MLCPRCSGKLIEAQPTCPSCGWARPVRDPLVEPEPPTAHWLSPDEAGPVNTSGTDLPPPQEVREMGYCWAGLALPFEFGWANNIAIGWVFSNLLVGVWLGRNGHQEAWRNRRFASLEQFRETMVVWNGWGVAALVARVLLLVLVVGTIVAARTWTPATEADLGKTTCLGNMRQIAHACLIYSYDCDDRLPLAESWRPALTPLLPYDKLPQCPQQTGYAFNRNVSGRRLPDLPRFVGLIYEADEQGRVAYVHPSSCGGYDANVACSNGEAFGECSKHPGRVDWAGPPPPGLAAKGAQDD
ncbi:MAG: hypothetical protein KKI08_20315 [Armatimonadetes bacterium]|nr:hypothetical protein [Armatimonadota bacterium]